MQKWVFGCVALSFRHLRAYIYVTQCICIKYLRAFLWRKVARELFLPSWAHITHSYSDSRHPLTHAHTHTHTHWKKTKQNKKHAYVHGDKHRYPGCPSTDTKPPHGASSHRCIGILAKKNPANFAIYSDSKIVNWQKL